LLFAKLAGHPGELGHFFMGGRPPAVRLIIAHDNKERKWDGTEAILPMIELLVAQVAERA
jgi:hypothetical protein